MMEHTTDRLFWTLTSVIVGALILTIGVKAFPNTTQSIFQPISGVMKQADTTNDNANNAANLAIKAQMTPDQQVEYDKTHAVEASKLGFTVFNIGDGTARIVGYDTSKGLDVTVPAYIKDHGQLLKVITIGSDYSDAHPYNEIDTFKDWYGFANLHLNSIHLPNTIQYLGWRSLWGNNFTNVDIPNSVQVIGDGSFGNSPKLKNVNIPKSTWLGRWLVDDHTTITRT